MRVKLLALIARALRIQFKVNGIPYGARRHQFRTGEFSQSAQA